MSNDVHIARVSKIQRSADTKGELANSRRCIGRSTKETHVEHQQQLQQQQSAVEADAVDFLFGSISPRAGHQLLFEMESPDHTQRDTNESDNNISSCSTLDIVNKVENLTLQQLESQVRELSQRLQQSDEQRNTLQHQLEESNTEKEVCLRRLEVVSSAHECRITEMHCVIAELSKKLRAKQESTILEEQEPDGSEISYQEGSIYNSELNLTNPDAECQTDPLDGVDYSAAEGYDNEDDANLCDEVVDDDVRLNDTATANKGQVEALQEEVLHLKAQIALLQSEIANANATVGDTLVVVAEEKQHESYDENVEANESNCSFEKSDYAGDEDDDEKLLNLITTTQHGAPLVSLRKPPPILKMAERVKLHCVSKIGMVDGVTVTASDLLNSELQNADIVEHLVADLKQDNSMMESFVDPAQLDNELQRLQRKVEHLKMRITVLTLTLDECKEHCEHLYLLCGKYESNAIALQSAVNCSDRAIEAYDVMLALLESKLALMKEKSAAAEDSRKAAESVARHLLDRLESEKDVCENSLGPWQNTFNIPNKLNAAPWTAEDDNRLRYHVSKLKGRRSTVQNTIVNLESPFSDFYEKTRMALERDTELHSKEKTAQLDLEMAVLMQELLNLREENIVLKTKADDAERERQYANDRIGILQEALKQLQMQLNVDTNALFHQQHIAEQRISYSEAEYAALTEQQLVEALTRESELKGRIQTLIASVAASQKMSDEKYAQLHNNVKELQNTNLSLAQMLEQSKRKYQTRIRKLESDLAAQQTSINHAMQQQQSAQRLRYKHSAATTKSTPQQHSNVPETTL